MRKIDEKIVNQNAKMLRQLSLYLNLMPDAITKDMVDEIAFGMGKEQREYAFASLLCVYLGFDVQKSSEDKEIFHNRILRMVHLEDAEKYKNDAFYKNIKIPEIKFGEWEMRYQKIKPYEAFLKNEPTLLSDGSLVPEICFFEEEFVYPAVLQNGREWMTVTPHEINSTLPSVNECFGNVVTYGLGIGYFAYMASLKENVKTVTIVEKDKAVIDIFTKYILPQFEYKDKIIVVNGDAFEFAKEGITKNKYDYVFADTWHDASDGIEMYDKFKSLEKYSPDTKFSYWIEKTLKYYKNPTEF